MEPILIYREDTKYAKEELEKVGNEIKDLQEVFENVNEMMIEQKNIIESLEDNIDKTLEIVKEGSKELEIADELDKQIVVKKGIISGLGLVAINVPVSMLLGIQISLPITIVGLVGIGIYVKIKG